MREGSPGLTPGLAAPGDSNAATLDAKLANFDRHVRDAVYDLIDLLFRDQDKLIALARERHIWGHHEYGDANLREWSDARLRVERDQEVADWLVYRVDEIRRGVRGV